MDLPRLMLVTGALAAPPGSDTIIAQALSFGLKFLQLRDKTVDAETLFQYSAHSSELCKTSGAIHVVNGAPDIARRSGSDGVHLPANGLQIEAARQLMGPGIIGVSIHNVKEAQRATAKGADYLVFGSVYATASHPGSTSVGLDALRVVAQATTLPVYAIGGVDASRVADCLATGAHGVAVISAIWEANDPGRAVKELLAAIDRAL